MIGAIAGDVIGSIYEGAGLKTTEFPLFGAHSRFTDDPPPCDSAGTSHLVGLGRTA